jgi:hypothetical protein
MNEMIDLISELNGKLREEQKVTSELIRVILRFIEINQAEVFCLEDFKGEVNYIKPMIQSRMLSLPENKRSR